jgi:hypothetical protein
MTFTRFHDIAKGMGQMLQITSVPTGMFVEFPAFIDSFSDSFNVSWGSEESFGRIDPVMPYRSTTRQISLGISVLSPDKNKAIENLREYSKLIQMLYPTYSAPLNEGGSKGRTITAPPILKVKLMNYIQSADGAGPLYGAIKGLKFDPDFKMGHFIKANGDLIPKKFTINFTFSPQHSKELGFGEDAQPLSLKFPYGESQSAPASEPAGRSNPAQSEADEAAALDG